jgi:hypothetical protein
MMLSEKMKHPLPMPSGRTAASDQMVDAKQDQRAYKRHQETCRLVRLVVADGAANPRPKKGPGNADQHGDEDAARFLAGNDELGKRAYNKTNDCRPQQMNHRYSSVISRGCRVVYKWFGKHTPASERCGEFVFTFTVRLRKDAAPRHTFNRGPSIDRNPSINADTIAVTFMPELDYRSNTEDNNNLSAVAIAFRRNIAA